MISQISRFFVSACALLVLLVTGGCLFYKRCNQFKTLKMESVINLCGRLFYNVKIYLFKVFVSIQYRSVVLCLAHNKDHSSAHVTRIGFQKTKMFIDDCMSSICINAFSKARCLLIIIEFHELKLPVEFPCVFKHKQLTLSELIVSVFNVTSICAEIDADLLHKEHSTLPEESSNLLAALVKTHQYNNRRFLPIELCIINLEAVRVHSGDYPSLLLRDSKADSATWYQQNLEYLSSSLVFGESKVNACKLFSLSTLKGLNDKLIPYLKDLYQQDSLYAEASIKVNYVLNHDVSRVVSNLIAQAATHQRTLRPIKNLGRLPKIKRISMTMIFTICSMVFVVMASLQYQESRHEISVMSERIDPMRTGQNALTTWRFIRARSELYRRPGYLSFMFLDPRVSSLLFTIERKLLEHNVFEPLRRLQKAAMQRSGISSVTSEAWRFKYYSLIKWLWMLGDPYWHQEFQLEKFAPNLVRTQFGSHQAQALLNYAVTHFERFPDLFKFFQKSFNSEYQAFLQKLNINNPLDSLLIEIRSRFANSISDYRKSLWEKEVKRVICQIKSEGLRYYLVQMKSMNVINSDRLRYRLLALYLTKWESDLVKQSKQITGAHGSQDTEMTLTFVTRLRRLFQDVLLLDSIKRTSINELCRDLQQMTSQHDDAQHIMQKIDAILMKLTSLYQQTDDLLHHKSSQKLLAFVKQEISGESEKFSTLFQLSNLSEFNQLPSWATNVFTGVIHKSLHRIWQRIYLQAVTAAEAAWGANLLPQYQERILERYPFDLSSVQEISLVDILQMTRPKTGEIARYYQETLRWLFAPSINKRFSFSLKRQSLKIKALLARSHKLFSLFSQKEGVHFSILPYPSPYISAFHFSLENKHFVYQNEPQRWVPFVWHIKTHAKPAIVYFQTVHAHKDFLLEESGIWSFVRVLQSASIKKLRAHVYRVAWQIQGKHKTIPMMFDIQFNTSSDLIKLLSLDS